MTEAKRPLKVFLSYASQDRPVVQELSRRLVGEGWVDTWLDVKKLLPGQDWRVNIEEAVEDSDIVIICLSSNSVTKEGYVQKELRYAREIALEKPEEAIFLVPLRLDECEVPRGLRFLQWVDYFGERKDESYTALIESLKLRHEQKLKLEEAEHVRKEKLEREIAERVAREKGEREAAEKLAQEKAAREKARVEAEELERQRIAREKAEQDAAAKALLKTTELEKKKVTSEPVQPRKEDTKKSVDGFLETHPWLFMGGLLITLVVLCWVAYQLGADLISPKATETAFNVTNASPTHTMTATLFFTPTKTITPALSKTPTATPYPTEITDAKGVSMMLVPAGEFTMGSNDGASYEQPTHTIYLDAFYIDTYEVSNALYDSCVNAGVCEAVLPKATPAPPVVDRTVGPNYPVVRINWSQAKIYCEWRGGQLPTEAQWEKSARGMNGFLYTWGNEYDYCGCCKGSYDSCGSMFPVDSFDDGVSPYGIFNLYGNASEWVADWFDDRYYQTMPLNNPLGPSTGTSRVIRGGSYSTIGGPDFVLSTRQWRSPHLFYDDVGFRCAKDANP